MTDSAIVEVRGRRVWDSRGRPTVEVEVSLDCGAGGSAIAPAGASKGTGEAVDLRDGGTALDGLDVKRALAAVNGEIAAALTGQVVADQAAIDRTIIEIDGTDNHSRLGSNASVATSMAVLNAAAASSSLPVWKYLLGDGPIRIPLPEVQLFGGGAHADRRVDVQDFMIMCPSANSFAEALEWTAEIYHAAGKRLKQEGKLQGVADEGGYWPAFSSNEEALNATMRAIEDAGLRPGPDVVISLDIAASEFGRRDCYRLALENRQLNTSQLLDMLGNWIDNYPIVSIEDPLAEDDLDGFREFTGRHGASCQIVGDDLLVTNADRIVAAARQGSANAVLLKPNQAGTVTETHDALLAARSCGLDTIVSARSGETEDVTIAHLAVGWDSGQFKVGSFSRSERMAKWNAMLRIEEQAGRNASFAGWSVLPGRSAD